MNMLEPTEIKKFAKKDPEEILYNSLYPKFGKRFRVYGRIKKSEIRGCSDTWLILKKLNT